MCPCREATWGHKKSLSVAKEEPKLESFRNLGNFSFQKHEKMTLHCTGLPACGMWLRPPDMLTTCSLCVFLHVSFHIALFRLELYYFHFPKEGSEGEGIGCRSCRG